MPSGQPPGPPIIPPPRSSHHKLPNAMACSSSAPSHSYHQASFPAITPPYRSSHLKLLNATAFSHIHPSPSGQRSSNIHGFLPKSAIETAVQCAVDFEERVEVGETELAFIVVEVMRDHEEDFQRKLGERHRDRIEVVM
jgi:hypothetical protein